MGRWPGMTKEASSKFEAFHEVMAMLHARGYVVSKSDREMDPTQFLQKYGDDMNFEFRTTKLGNKKDQILVSFTDILSNKVVRDTKFQMEKEGVHTVIFVVQQRVLSNAVAECNNSVTVFFEIFKEAELDGNVMVDRRDVHGHRVLSEDEKTALLQKKDFDVTQLERIQVSDPVAKYFGMRPGQVLKRSRRSEGAVDWMDLYRDVPESACKFISYRLAA